MTDDSRPRRRLTGSLVGRITLMFVVLTVVLEGLTAIYWVSVLQPRLRAEAESSFRALVQSHGRSLADALNPTESGVRQDEVRRIVDEILLLTDPNTDSPFIVGLEMELDYDVFEIPDGALDVQSGETDCPDCFVAEIPLYDERTRELLGTGIFHGSGAFYQRFGDQVRSRVVLGALGALLLLVLAWWGLVVLLRPLESLAHSLRSQHVEDLRPLQELPRVASDEIQLVRTALDDLLMAINEREEALQEANERLAATLNALPDLLFVVDQEGRIYDHRAPNPDLLHVPPEVFLNKKVSEVLPAEVAQIIMQSIADAAGTGRHRGGTYTLEMPTGPAWFELSIAAIGSEVTDARYVTLARDITERKKTEQERLHLERQVQHAQKLESLGVLSGGIAHDFNNLLVAILGNADLALDRLPPVSPARTNLREIGKASKRAAELAKQMLAYSGKGQFVVEPIDARELLGEMTHLLEVSISKKVVLKYDFAENLPTFDGDVTQIGQVVMNLITNASEAIGDKSGVITLSAGAMHCEYADFDDVNDVLRASFDYPLPEGVYVYLEVADTGCGVDAESVEKIFDPFFTTKFTGRGLGMSVVLGIVRAHRGLLKVDSEVGKGTTFKVLFPASEQVDDGLVVRRIEAVEGKDWRGSGTVLVVDDEETVCAVSKQMLEGMGFSVLTATDGREGLNVFREHADEIVCVLLDLTMPHMDGEETFREMRRLHPDVTVILCSGYVEQDATERFAGKGPAGFLQKPFSMAALRETLAEILRERTRGVEDDSVQAGAARAESGRFPE